MTSYGSNAVEPGGQREVRRQVLLRLQPDQVLDHRRRRSIDVRSSRCWRCEQGAVEVAPGQLHATSVPARTGTSARKNTHPRRARVFLRAEVRVLAARWSRAADPARPEPDPARPAAPAVAYVDDRAGHGRHLVGLQAQDNLPPYLGLAARLEAFDPYDVTRGLEDRSLVRLLTMRSTVHLLVADDALMLRRFTRPIHERERKVSQMVRAAIDVDLGDFSRRGTGSARRRSRCP